MTDKYLTETEAWKFVALLEKVKADILSVVSLCATGGRIVHKNFSLTV
jgi:hypothetical protein